MWSLFPQTSSSNLNNNVYTPPPPPPRPPPGFGGPGAVMGAEMFQRWGRARGSPERPGVAGCTESAPSSRAPAAAGGPEGLSPGRRTRGRGMGAGSAPRCPRRRGSLAGRPTLASGLRAPRPTAPRLPAGAPHYLGSDPAGRSPRRCHSALCETDTQAPVRKHRRPPAASAQARLPHPRARGRLSTAVAGTERAGLRGRRRALPRIRRFFSERPRPIAAILTGFSHNTGNLAQSRENPFPSPRAAPAPPPRTAAAPPPLGTESRPRAWSNAVRSRGGMRHPGRGDGPGVRAQAWWEAPFPRGIPIDVERSPRAGSAGGRDAGCWPPAEPPCSHSSRGSKACFLTHRLQLFLLKKEKRKKGAGG